MHATRPSLTARVLALTALGRAYTRSAEHGAAGFTARALAELDLSSAVDSTDLARIPARGPLVVTANHPFGGIDGLLLLELLGRRRGDVKLLGNRLLEVIPPLRPHLLRVDLWGPRRTTVARNALALRKALRWLRRGGCLVVFPAGEVAHVVGPGGRTTDSPWQTAAADLAVRADADVLPVFFPGSNSRLFRIAGRVHPLLRTALLPREMWAMRGATVDVRIGHPVAFETLSRVPDVEGRTALLRRQVEALAPPPVPAPVTGPALVAARGDGEAIEHDIAALQPRVLLESGQFQVFCAQASELPAVLPEIGRLREVAFRRAGEGSGLSRDLDRFDQTYRHLFVWDRSLREIAGAYRVGATDVVARDGRVEGLYTRTLFDYGPELLAQVGPALELGRAFVQPAYQRSFSPLLLLWKGISRLVARAPRYRRLFGLVSISDDYDTTSRQLLVKFLQSYRFDGDLARLVRARNPLPPLRDPATTRSVRTLEEVSALVRGIERDGKDVPVLLRQYLKLNAKLLGFSVDPTFGAVLDGLLVVDLTEVEPVLLERFMGREDARAFLASVAAN